MTIRRNYTGKRCGPNGEYASKQEMGIHTRYPGLQYQPPIRIHYTQDFVYLPDFRLGIHPVSGLAVYVEAKELFTTDMCAKYEAVVDSNKSMHLVIVTPNITIKDMQRLNSHPRITVHLSKDTLPRIEEIK